MASTKDNWFPNGESNGLPVWSPFGVAQVYRIDKVLASAPTTTFYLTALKAQPDGRAYWKNDFFNTGWKVRGINCNTAANNAVAFDVTDFVASDGKIVTAACTTGWAVGDQIMLCTDEYNAMVAGTSSTGAGKEFTITKTLTKVSVVQGGVALTGAASGNVVLKRVAIQNDTTAAGGATAGIYIYSNDTIALNEKIISDGTADLGASAFVATDIGYSVATGKILSLKSGDATALSGAGSIAVHLTFVRNADGATIAAA